MKKAIIVAALAVSFIFLSSMALLPQASTIEEEPTEEMFDLAAYYKENPEELESKTQPIADAKAMAMVADAIAPDSDDNCKTAIFQLILNRSRTAGFPNTLEDVCLQANQWQGVTSQSSYSAETLKLAKEFVNSLNEYRIAPIGRDNVYLRVGATGLYFRASWDDTNETFIGFYS